MYFPKFYPERTGDKKFMQVKNLKRDKNTYSYFVNHVRNGYTEVFVIQRDANIDASIKTASRVDETQKMAMTKDLSENFKTGLYALNFARLDTSHSLLIQIRVCLSAQ